MQELALNKNLPYGGSYIDDKGVLNVGLVNKDIIKERQFNEIVRGKKIKYFNVEHSYKDLRDDQQLLISLLDQIESESGLNITKMYVDEIRNKLMIGVEKKNPGLEKLIKQAVKNPGAVEFFEEDFAISTNRESNIRPLIGGSATSKGTLTFAAKRNNGDYGVVVCGHCYTEGTSVNQFTSKIGSVAVNPINITRNSDAAFVKTDANIKVRGEAYRISSTDTYKINAGIYSDGPPIGLVVTKSGRTTNVTSGKVLNKGVTVYFGTDYHYNKNIFGYGRMFEAVEADYTSDKGDSGSPVLFASGAFPNMSLAGASFGKSSSTSYFSPVHIILQELGVSHIQATHGDLAN
jgi:hypothetical protein